jgi:hypothetical protein
MSPEDEIRNLLFRYCELIDAGDVDALGDVFADAAIIGQDGNTMAQGRDQVRAMYGGGNRAERTSGTRASKHVNTNVLVEVDEDAGTAIARSYWILVVSTSPDEPVRPILAGRYHDTFAKRDGAWRFTERRYLVDLSGSESAALLGG